MVEVFWSFNMVYYPLKNLLEVEVFFLTQQNNQITLKVRISKTG